MSEPCHWIKQAAEYAREIAACGGRLAALLADSLKRSEVHLLLIENGFEVRFSPYLEAGAAYMVDASRVFPTDAEQREQIRAWLCNPTAFELAPSWRRDSVGSAYWPS